MARLAAPLRLRRGAEALKTVCAEVIGPQSTVTADGKLSWLEVECLGACDMAPMASVNERYFGPLEKADAKTIVDQLHEGAEVLPDKSLAERHLPGGDGDPGGEKVTGLKGPNQ